MVYYKFRSKDIYLFINCPHNSKKTGMDWRRSKEGPQRWSRGWRTCPVRRLKELDLFSLEKAQEWPSFLLGKANAQEEPHHSILVLKGWSQRQKSNATRSYVEKTRGHECKLHQEMFHFTVRDNFLLWEQPFTRTTLPGAWQNPHRQQFSRCS